MPLDEVNPDVEIDHLGLDSATAEAFIMELEGSALSCSRSCCSTTRR
jgi:hypothetical protein